MIERRPMLAALLAAFAIGMTTVSPAPAQCVGDCSAELLDAAKAVEKYVKKAWKSIATCARRAEPTCPTECPLPDATAEPFSLGASCADLLVCELNAMAGEAYGAVWDTAGECALAEPDSCGTFRAKAAGKLLVKKLKRRRTSKMDKLARDTDKCAIVGDKPGACDAAALCAAAGEWVDAIYPLDLGKGGYQRLVFDVAAGGEAWAELMLSAATADWLLLGRESVVVEYDVDGAVLGTIVVYNGPVATSYRVLLGELTPGTHTLGLRHAKRLSPAKDSPVRVHAAPALTVLAPADPDYDAIRFAPVLLGLDRKLNVFNIHPGNAVSDVPVVEYVRAIPGTGMTTYRYVMIWSNEDGGTGQFPEVLMAQYGRTTDIETIVEVDVADDGTLLEVRYRPDESGSLAVFAGAFLGTHPIVRTATANGLIADDGDSTLRFLLAPFVFDDSGVPREQGMDLDPVSYRIMAEEMIREGKIEPTANPANKKLSDQRNYLFIEYDIDVDVSGRVLRAIAVVDGTTYASDHFQLSGGPLARNVSDGVGRTAVELPPGTTLADIDSYGMQGIGTMSGTLFRLEAFLLDAEFLPGARLSFVGSLFASGSSPTWSVTP